VEHLLLVAYMIILLQQFKIRLCPALPRVLLHKPNLPTPHFEATSVEYQKEKRADVFQLLYKPNLYVSKLQDEGQSTRYDVVLVSGWSHSLPS